MKTPEEYNKNEIANKRNTGYIEFKKKLAPDYFKVWLDLLSGLIMLPVIGIFVFMLNYYFPYLFILWILAGSVLLGYLMAYIQLFFHEAAHYNIAKGKKTNDILANIFIGLFIGEDIKFYRLMHFEHHRHLGKIIDTEHSYFDPLNIRFIIESITGIKALKVRKRRNKFFISSSGQKITTLNKQLLAGISLHLIIIGILAYFKQWTVIFSWVIGMGIFFPFFNSLRQLLEHRSESASKKVDYSKVPHGETNRMFGDSFIARTFGGAGFNRHLLHHWEPQVSYTRLKDLENFLMETESADILQQHSSSYLKVFLKLFNR